jgi:hypothetical protein
MKNAEKERPLHSVSSGALGNGDEDFGHIQPYYPSRKRLRARPQVLFFILHSALCIQKYSGSLPGFHLMLQPMLGC